MIKVFMSRNQPSGKRLFGFVPNVKVRSAFRNSVHTRRYRRKLMRESMAFIFQQLLEWPPNKTRNFALGRAGEYTILWARLTEWILMERLITNSHHSKHLFFETHVNYNGQPFPALQQPNVMLNVVPKSHDNASRDVQSDDAWFCHSPFKLIVIPHLSTFRCRNKEQSTREIWRVWQAHNNCNISPVDVIAVRLHERRMIPRRIFQIGGIIVHKTSSQGNIGGTLIKAQRWPQHVNDKVFDVLIEVLFDLNEACWYPWDFFDNAVLGQAIFFKTRNYFKFHLSEAKQWIWLNGSNVMVRKLPLTGTGNSTFLVQVWFQKIVSERSMLMSAYTSMNTNLTIWLLLDCACIAFCDIAQHNLISPVVSQTTFSNNTLIRWRLTLTRHLERILVSRDAIDLTMIFTLFVVLRTRKCVDIWMKVMKLLLSDYNK